jgi:hypothetical protein
MTGSLDGGQGQPALCGIGWEGSRGCASEPKPHPDPTSGSAPRLRRPALPASFWRYRGLGTHPLVQAVLRASPGGVPIWLAAIAAAAILLRWPRLPPVALIAAGGALFGAVAAVYQ